MPARNHSQANVVRKLLVNLGLATDPPAPGRPPGQWPASADGELDRPDEVITVTDTTGRLEGSDMPTGEVWEHDGIQIRIRSNLAKVGYLKASQIAAALSEQVYWNTVTLNNASGGGTTTYLVQCVRRSTPILPLGKEPNSRRSLHTINFLVDIEQVG